MAILTDLGVYTLPSWAILYLIYGEEEGLTDAELEMAAKFTLEFSTQGYFNLTYDVSAESEFSHRPEFGLPGDCHEVRIYAQDRNRKTAL